MGTSLPKRLNTFLGFYVIIAVMFHYTIFELDCVYTIYQNSIYLNPIDITIKKDDCNFNFAVPFFLI